MCNEAVDTHPSRIRLFLNPIRLKKCAIKYLIDVLLHLILFLIGIKLNECVTELFPKILFNILKYGGIFACQKMGKNK